MELPLDKLLEGKELWGFWRTSGSFGPGYAIQERRALMERLALSPWHLGRLGPAQHPNRFGAKG